MIKACGPRSFRDILRCLLTPGLEARTAVPPPFFFLTFVPALEKRRISFRAGVYDARYAATRRSREVVGSWFVMPWFAVFPFCRFAVEVALPFVVGCAAFCEVADTILGIRTVSD